MPTENRSSKTEMATVLAPFAAVADCYDDAEDDGFEPASDRGMHRNLSLTLGQFRAVRAFLAQPTPQPHPEPIAWMVGTAIWWTKEEAERDAAETGLPMVGMGPMTDTAELERLRGENDQLREVIRHSDSNIQQQNLRISNQRAQLAELGALLTRMKGLFRVDDPFELHDAVCSMLANRGNTD